MPSLVSENSPVDALLANATIGRVSYAPGALNPESAFESLALWMSGKIQAAPGLVLGLSGTDSLAAFAVCSRALEILGRDPQKELTGIHFEILNAAAPDNAALKNESSSKNNELLEFASKLGKIEFVDLPSSPLLEADPFRWAVLQSRALRTEAWLIGTRNKSEDSLGAYSTASTIAVLQPLMSMWKTDVLNLCDYLGVPSKLIAASRVADCECGRAKQQGKIEWNDRILNAKEEGLEMSELVGVPKEYGIQERQVKWVETFQNEKTYKKVIPYAPSNSVLRPAMTSAEGN